MKVVNSEEMKRIDKLTIEDYGIPSLVLMERAGLAVASKIKEIYPPQKVLIVAGRGNNGGDGLVIARILHTWGYKVKAIILAKKEELSQDCKKQFEIATNIGIEIEFSQTLSDRDLHGSIVVDAIFGTGLNKPVDETLLRVFSQLNNSNRPVVAVDIPSGVSADDGEVFGGVVRATFTVTFGLPKRGHFLYPGASYTGRLFIENIGFDIRLLQSEDLKVNLIVKEKVSKEIPLRERYSHKGDYGHVLIVAGSMGKTGAAIMTAKSCTRSGSGLVTLGIPESLMSIIQNRVTEEMTLPLKDTVGGMLSAEAIDEILSFQVSRKINTIAIGPGIGVSKDTEKIMSDLIRNSTVPLVIDADGINSLCANPQTLLKAKSPIILTPHPGEMARLCSATYRQDFSNSDIERDRIGISLKFAKEHNCFVVLKGVPTIVTSPEGEVFINSTGNPGMATGGSGDVLTGIIASLCGQGLTPLSASICGVYLHGLAGDLGSVKKGEYSLTAQDIIDFLSDAFLAVITPSLREDPYSKFADRNP